MGPVRSLPVANLETITIVFTMQTRRLDELAGISPEETIIPSFSLVKIVPPLAEAMRFSLAPSDVSAQGIQGSSVGRLKTTASTISLTKAWSHRRSSRSFV